MTDPRTGVDIDHPLRIDPPRDEPLSWRVIIACAVAMIAIWALFWFAVGRLPA